MIVKKSTFSAFLGMSFLVHAALVLWLVLASPASQPGGRTVMEVSLVSLPGYRTEPPSPGPAAPAHAVAAVPRPSALSPGKPAQQPEREGDGPAGNLEASPSLAAGSGTGDAGASDTGEHAPPQPQGHQGEAGASLTSYNRLVMDIISRNRHYPENARRRGIEGSVDIRFTIDRTGQAGDVRVVKSSGAGILDRASVRTVQGCSFPPPPGDAVTLPITITFRLVDDPRL